MQLWMPCFPSTTALAPSIFAAAGLRNNRIYTLNLRMDDLSRWIDELCAEIMPILHDIHDANRARVTQS